MIKKRKKKPGVVNKSGQQLASQLTHSSGIKGNPRSQAIIILSDVGGYTIHLFLHTCCGMVLYHIIIDWPVEHAARKFSLLIPQYLPS